MAKARDEGATAIAPAVPVEATHYRVRLEGCKVRVLEPDPRDPEGPKRAVYRDYLDVQASSPAEARAKFERYNGILGTTRAWRIEPIAKDEATNPI